MKKYILNYNNFLSLNEKTNDETKPKKDVETPVIQQSVENKKLGNLWILANAKKIKDNYTGENLYCYEFVRGVIRLSLGGGDGKSYGDNIASKLLSGFANNELAVSYPSLKDHLLDFEQVKKVMKDNVEQLRTAQKTMVESGLGEAFDDPLKAKPGDLIQYYWVDFHTPKMIDDKKMFSFTGHMAIVGSEDNENLYTIGSGASKGFNGKYFTKVNQLWTHIPKKSTDDLLKGVPITDKDGKKFNKYYRTFFFRIKNDLLKKYYDKDKVFIESTKTSQDISDIHSDDINKPNLSLIKNVGSNKSLMV